jgi:hypothetical protein
MTGLSSCLADALLGNFPSCAGYIINIRDSFATQQSGRAIKSKVFQTYATG